MMMCPCQKYLRALRNVLIIVGIKNRAKWPVHVQYGCLRYFAVKLFSKQEILVQKKAKPIFVFDQRTSFFFSRPWRGIRCNCTLAIGLFDIRQVGVVLATVDVTGRQSIIIWEAFLAAAVQTNKALMFLWAGHRHMNYCHSQSQKWRPPKNTYIVHIGCSCFHMPQVRYIFFARSVCPTAHYPIIRISKSIRSTNLAADKLKIWN